VRFLHLVLLRRGCVLHQILRALEDPLALYVALLSGSLYFARDVQVAGQDLCSAWLCNLLCRLLYCGVLLNDVDLGDVLFTSLDFPILIIFRIWITVLVGLRLSLVRGGVDCLFGGLG